MDTLCPGLGAWHEMKLAIVIRFPFPNSVGSPYGDPDVVDASLGTLTQQRQQEVLIRFNSQHLFKIVVHGCKC